MTENKLESIPSDLLYVIETGNEYKNVHFVGDALSARGITVSGAHGIYVAEYLLS